MLMRTDPFRELDRLTLQVLGGNDTLISAGPEPPVALHHRPATQENPDPNYPKFKDI
jgi:hypothetical protein